METPSEPTTILLATAFSTVLILGFILFCTRRLEKLLIFQTVKVKEVRTAIGKHDDVVRVQLGDMVEALKGKKEADLFRRRSAGHKKNDSYGSVLGAQLVKNQTENAALEGTTASAP
ncbi:hypothetical protein EJ08DRAFT_491361 [Tothia fuscella]|uniref:Uncharacterized protein n=1 Tax=Tothia fuscella TaxID=1048955 RepID=A0A9P4NHV0_9PEZI|nr:hypothetical protein EJ08DRAFT_491361 [Tothia fuscella]